MGGGRLNIHLSDEQLAKFSRYGLEPFNWVVDDKVLASVYPTGPEFLQFIKGELGIDLAINLAESPWPDEWITISGVRSLHFPVVDMMTPERGLVKEVIRNIDSHEGAVLVHCAAGIGRTGTIIITLNWLGRKRMPIRINWACFLIKQDGLKKSDLLNPILLTGPKSVS